MKKIVQLVALAALLLVSAGAVAQNVTTAVLSDTTDGNSYTYAPGVTFTVRDDDANGSGGYYTLDRDNQVHITGSCTGSSSHLCIRIDQLDIRCCDTLYMYDGPTATGTPRAKINSYTGHKVNDLIFISPDNATGEFTLRFVTRSRYDYEDPNDACFQGGKGFKLRVMCSKPCETVTPVILPVFDRTRNGEVYAHDSIRKVPVYDTVYAMSGNDTIFVTIDGIRQPKIDHIDTSYYDGAHLCIGDGVIFHGTGEYSYRYGYYTPNDATSTFTWSMGHGEGVDLDTLIGVGLSSVDYDGYQEIACSELALTIVDEFGCASTEDVRVIVRTASNPIKTIFTLADICNNDSLMVNMGYGRDNATLTLAEIREVQVVTKINADRVFIPDGGNCNGMPFYEAPVLFTEYPSNKKVESGTDICSICLNYEHSFMGDYAISIVCPTGQEAYLKYGSYTANVPTTGGQRDNGTDAGGGTFTGIPLDGFNGFGDSYPVCDSTVNPFGFGYDYCFSRNGDYTLVTGQLANITQTTGVAHPAGNFYLGSSAYTISVTHTFPAGWIPAGFAQAGQSPGTGTVTTKKPSDYEGKTDYYLPYTDFSELIGCPLNGTWSLRFYDDWAVDNGWIFSWWMDICGVSASGDCKYDVGIDSLIWVPDPSPQYHDYDLGYYRGAVIHQATPTISYILTPDTAGTFPILVYAYDEFGCVWDTSTRITTYWTPEPHLPADTVLCGIDTLLLDASDRHTGVLNYTYQWDPFGESSPQIYTRANANSDITYRVEAINYESNKRCVARDEIAVRVRPKPIPSLEPNIFPLEGCGPLEVSFVNNTVGGDIHRWDFGDGVVSQEKDARHIYAPGTYQLRYTVTNDGGCADSIYPYPTITVFDTPKAAFSWDPIYPTVVSPVIHLHNETETELPGTQYRWEVQYDRDNFQSVQTLTSPQGEYRFTSDEHDVAGNYTLRLIAFTDNLGPSGANVRCADTAENAILLVNDFLQFPNVVTPNGDGVNDVFVIQNLVTGQGYPNNTLDIYNKWGVLVFHRENIRSEADFWDPSDVPAGTYFYRFSARGYNGNIERNGAVEVLK